MQCMLVAVLQSLALPMEHECASPKVRSSKLSLRRKRDPQHATCSTQPAQVQTSSSVFNVSIPPSSRQTSSPIQDLSVVLSRCTQVQTSVSSKSLPPPPRQPPIHGLSVVLRKCTQTSPPETTPTETTPTDTVASSGDKSASREDANDVHQSKVVSSTGFLESTHCCDGDGTKMDEAKDAASNNTRTSPTHANETLPGNSAGDGFGELFFCQICQKDLTHLNVTRRTQHINRCCDTQVVECCGQTSHICILCKREFKAEQSMLSHMKGCAREKGVSTAQLLSMRRKDEQKSSSQTVKAGMCGGSTEAGVSRKTSGEEDFKQLPPPKRARLKQGGRGRRAGGHGGYMEALDDEELQLALALSASMHPQAMHGGGEEEEQRAGLRRRGKKRSKKGECNEAPPPLLLTSSSQAENIAAEKAAQILEATKDGGPSADGDGIPCTPAFGASELRRAGPASLLHSVRPPPHTLDAVDELLSVIRDEPEHVAVDPKETMIAIPREEIQCKDQDPGLEPEPSGASGTPPHARECGDKPTTVVQARATPPMSSGMASSTMANATGHWSQLVLDTADGEDLGYPTLWQMTSLREEEKEMKNFYVPALTPVISPVKRDTCLCRICGCEPCLAVATSGPEGAISCSSTARTSTVRGSSATPTISAGFLTAEDEEHVSGFGQLVADLRSLVGSRLLSDVLITTRDGHEVPAHAVILAARCPTLRKMLEESTCRPVQLNLSDYDDDTVFAFLEHVYCGQGPPLHKKETVESLLSQRWSIEDDRLRPLRETVEDGDGKNLESGRGEVENRDVEVCDLTLDSNTIERNIVEARPSVEGEGCVLSPSITDGETEAKVQSCSASPDRAQEMKWTSPRKDSGVLQTPIDSSPTSRTRQDNGSKSPVMELWEERVPSTSTAGAVEIINDPSDSSMEGDATATLIVDDSVCMSEILARGDDNPDYVEVADTPLPSPGRLSHSKVVTSQLGEVKDVINLDASPTGGGEFGSNEIFTIESRSPSVQNFSSPSPTDEPWQEPVGSQAVLPPFTEDGYHCETDTVVAMDTGPSVEETFPTGQNQLVAWSSANSATPTVTPISVPSSSASVLSSSLPHFISPGATMAVSRCSAVETDVNTTLCAATPACRRAELESDDNITPMPDYRGMRTPQLKGQCSRFGVRVLPKKKMINKLEEIYNYTHPLVDEDDNFVLPPLPRLDLSNRKPKAADPANTDELCSVTSFHGNTAVSSSDGPRPKSKQKAKKQGENSEQATSGGTMEKVREVVVADTELYQNVLLYKPLELSFIQERLKMAGVGVGKDKLADILDHLCVTFTQPRNSANTQRPKKITRLQ